MVVAVAEIVRTTTGLGVVDRDVWTIRRRVPNLENICADSSGRAWMAVALSCVRAAICPDLVFPCGGMRINWPRRRTGLFEYRIRVGSCPVVLFSGWGLSCRYIFGCIRGQVLLRDFCYAYTFRKLAAISIQAQWRRYITRKHHFAYFATIIERICRGYAARLRVARLRQELREVETRRCDETALTLACLLQAKMR